MSQEAAVHALPACMATCWSSSAALRALVNRRSMCRRWLVWMLPAASIPALSSCAAAHAASASSSSSSSHLYTHPPGVQCRVLCKGTRFATTMRTAWRLYLSSLTMSNFSSFF